MSIQSKPSRFAYLLMTFSALALNACVTVNVNFPEGAAQKATDDYVQDLYRARERGKTPTAQPSSSAQPSSAPTDSKTTSSWMPGWVSEAQADEGGFKVNTPKTLAIQDQLRAMLPDVLAQKRAGVIGETNAGLIVLKDNGQIKPLLKAKIDKLVADENNARTSLYHEVLSANGFANSKLTNVAQSFARSFQAESPSKTWVQDGNGKWSQKP